MTDSMFEKLKNDIEQKTRELELLQKKYKSQVGRRYVVTIYIERAEKRDEF